MKKLNLQLNAKNNAIIFPYDYLNPSIILEPEISSKFNIKSIVTLPCYNLGSFMSVNGVKVEYDFDSAMISTECIIWTQSRLFDEEFARSFIMEKIKQSLLSNKKVFCFQKLDIATLQFFETFNSQGEVIFYNLNYVDLGNKSLAKSHQSLKPIVDLVISVVKLPLLEEISLLLRKEYKKNHLNFAQVFSNGLGNLCNSYVFPEIFELSQYSIYEKAHMFNDYINDISIQTASNRILLTSPYPLFPINEMDITDYGVYLNIISALINDGITYVVLDCDSVSEDYLDYIVNYLKYRYNRNSIKFIMSNIHINSIDLHENPQYIGYDIFDEYPWELDEDIKGHYYLNFTKDLL